jgi:hypothetical protein
MSLTGLAALPAFELILVVTRGARWLDIAVNSLVNIVRLYYRMYARLR